MGTGWRTSRREFLRAVGLGGASAIATRNLFGGSAGAAAPDATDVADDSQVGWRRPGGPTVEQVARELDYDIERIFRFVADEVQYDPYAGVLRGAKGTLWSRAGNSADQAVLLAALLNEALIETRFAIGTLDGTTAAALHDAAIIDGATLRARLGPRFGVTREPTAEEAAIAARPDSQRFIAELPDRAERLVTAARDQLDDGVSTIVDALAESGIVLPAHSFELPDSERREHVWVQYASGAEWVDLDPALPLTPLGQAATVAATTPSQLDDRLRHAVTIVLTSEVISAGAPRRQELIRYSAFTEDLVGSPVSIAHLQPDGFEAVGASILGALDGTVQYVPLIVVGDWAEAADHHITFVTDDGVLSVFGDESSNEGDTLAEWMEVTISSPESPDHTVIREIFDRVGVVNRAAGDIDLDDVEPVELVEIGERAAAEYLPLSPIWSLAVTGGSTPWEYFDQDVEIDDLLADLGVLSEGYSVLHDATRLAAGSAYGYRYLNDAPNVTAFVAGVTAATAAGPQIGTYYDLLSRSFSAVPLADMTAPDGPAPLVAGVLSHVAERLSRSDWQGNPDVVGVPISVGRIFEQALREGTPIQVVTGDIDADDADHSPEARYRIAAATEAGLVVVTPARPVVIGDEEITGWWVIDPTTGAAYDQLENGRGTEMTEYLLALRPWLRAVLPVIRLGNCIAKVSTIAVAILDPLGNVPGIPDNAGVALALANAVAAGVGEGFYGAAC